MLLRLPLLFAVTLLCVSCYDNRTVMPGLYIGHDGRILKAGPEAVREDRERRLVTAINAKLGEQWRSAVSILSPPYSLDEQNWQWDKVSVAVKIVGDGTSSQPPVTIAQIASLVQGDLLPSVRGGALPEVGIVVDRAGAPAPALEETSP